MEHQTINLQGKGVKVFYGKLYNHDYLWFSSTEISKIITTIPVIHNYALSYALSNFSYGIFEGNKPRYFDYLKQMNIYATPAINLQASKITISFNAMDDLTLTTGDSKKSNTPNIGKRVYVNPIYETNNSYYSLRQFRLYAFCLKNAIPPSVIRVGKKGCSCRIHWEEILNPVAKLETQFFKPTHPVNPLDVSGEIDAFDLVNIPPHSFFRTAKIKNDWVIRVKEHCILLPKLIRERI